jgi:protein-S-isoprenylcysteine O-methyltransferase Ste14
MEIPILVLGLLLATGVLHVGHTMIHVMTSLVWRADSLPSYDTAVGYLGALAWFIMLIADAGTLDLHQLASIPPGLALSALGLYVHGIGVRDLVRHRDEGPLVTQGVYARLRHPIYYGWVLVSFGLPLVLMSHWGLLTAPLWAGLIIVCGILEERDLRRQLPEGLYEAYSRTTWL